MLTIGNNICLGDPYLDTHERITIGNEVLFGWGVKILTGSHHYTSFGVERHTNVNHKPVVIEEGAWLGSYSIILPGSHIGKHAVVAAGSVVHGDVEPYTVVGGNPAKFIKEIPH
jgi:acetyltransferase-like isoleucine patch superfamily enzyme